MCWSRPKTPASSHSSRRSRIVVAEHVRSAIRAYPTPDQHLDQLVEHHPSGDPGADDSRGGRVSTRSGNSSRNGSHNGSMTEDGSAREHLGKEGDVRHPFCYRGSCLSCVTDTRLSAQSLGVQRPPRSQAYTPQEARRDTPQTSPEIPRCLDPGPVLNDPLGCGLPSRLTVRSPQCGAGWTQRTPLRSVTPGAG